MGTCSRCCRVKLTHLAVKRIAVAGNPNSGKTTVFNALTGLRHRVGNYPGVTVEQREGVMPESGIRLVDLPGTYALSARSPDEQVARDVLLWRGGDGPVIDGVLIVIDASNLERNLYLASQILELGLPAVIACNMMDVAAGRGKHVDCAELAEALGVPVISVVASRGKGIAALQRALEGLDGRSPPPRPWRLAKPFEEAIGQAADVMVKTGGSPPQAARGAALLWLCDYLSGETAARKGAEEFLAGLSSPDAAELRIAAAAVAATSDDAAAAAIEARYAWISQLARQVVKNDARLDRRLRSSAALAERLDHVLAHRVFGLAIFAGVMLAMFLAVFFAAEPLMGAIETGQQYLVRGAGSLFQEGPIRSLASDGIIAGVGAVVIFFPQICILFLCLAVLEDSGYLARAAFLMDRLMSRVGLHGRSFIPLLCGYACAVPAVMATRTIENRRDRLATMLVVPFMTCSARLPVYLTLIGAVFPGRVWLKAVTMLGLYVFGTVTALVVALVLKRTLLAGPQPTFIMELPAYHLPRPWPIVRLMWDRSKVFLTRAGTVIFIASVAVWALGYFPHGGMAVALDGHVLPDSMAAQGRGHATHGVNAAAGAPGSGRIPGDALAAPQTPDLAAARLEHSYLGRLGRAIEPALRPLGYDWRIGTGLLSSLLAREMFVSTLSITLAVEDDGAESQGLREHLAAATWPGGRKLLTPLVGVGLMVFYVLACQCVSTLAVVRRETQSWRWPAFMFGYMTVMAYIAALAVYQVGTRLGWAG